MMAAACPSAAIQPSAAMAGNQIHSPPVPSGQLTSGNPHKRGTTPEKHAINFMVRAPKHRDAGMSLSSISSLNSMQAMKQNSAL